MKRLTLFTCLALSIVFAVSALAANEARDDRFLFEKANPKDSLHYQTPGSLGKARQDTILVIGPGGADADFEDAGSPAWEGWTPVDRSAVARFWQTSTTNAANLDPQPDNKAWWCGRNYVACTETDPTAGYGNGWIQWLDLWIDVADPAGAATATLTGLMNYDTEPAYDYVYLQYDGSGGIQQQNFYDGFREAFPLNEEMSFTSADYLPNPEGGAPAIHLRFSFESDTSWSDADCLYSTNGACQIDNIEVTVSQAGQSDIVVMDDGEVDDAVWAWFGDDSTVTGNFGTIYNRLNDVDDCAENLTPAVAFVDNGIIVPESPGYFCTTWCYGPGGYIVNPEGGLAGPEFNVENEIWSPIVAWPGQEYDGAYIDFDVFRHQLRNDNTVDADIRYTWHVRSSAADGVGGNPPAEDTFSGWKNAGFSYIGGPDWFRRGGVAFPVTTLMEDGRQWVQLAMGVWDVGIFTGFEGVDAAPAPYFDNARFAVYRIAGPAFTNRNIDLANDDFPIIGEVDYANPAANKVRFDMAIDVASTGEPYDPGDSITVICAPARAGTALDGPPVMHYHMRPNMLFGIDVRDAMTSWDDTVGVIVGQQSFTSGGNPVADKFFFDFPENGGNPGDLESDGGFIYPGDQIHYYFEASDNGPAPNTTTFPGILTNYGIFPGDPGYQGLDNGYDANFQYRALPSIKELGADPANPHPEVLWWNDFGDRAGIQEWQQTFFALGWVQGVDYDVYQTQGPSSGVGNGLGGRATSAHLADYSTILYGSGDLQNPTISNGDNTIVGNDTGQDVQTLDAWMAQGNKNLFLTGDYVVDDMVNAGGAATLAFINDWVSVGLVTFDLRPLLDPLASQTPSVQATEGSFFIQQPRWVADGGCPIINEFDAVQIVGATLQAEFLDSDCLPYPGGDADKYAAATSYVGTGGSETVYLPYDYSYITNDFRCGGAPGAREGVLRDVMAHFGVAVGTGVVAVPDRDLFSVRNFPNPFNPITKIEYNMPRQGELAIKIFNVRGELVRTLIDQVVPAGSEVLEWNGTDDGGQAVASGVYFYETRALGNLEINKMALVK